MALMIELTDLLESGSGFRKSAAYDVVIEWATTAPREYNSPDASL